MNTDDFISSLAGAPRLPSVRPALRTAPVAAAAALSLSLLAATLGLRPDLALLAQSPLFWLKLGFVGLLATLGWRAARIAALPGARFRSLPLLAGALAALMAGAAAVTLLAAAPEARAQQFWGATWRSCPFIIALMAAPILAAMLHAMRQLASTRLRLAGAIAGACAGALAACLYCLHCPELAPAFVGSWYVLGMAIPAAAGALLGPRALAW